GERHAAFADARLAAYPRGDLQRLVEHEAEHRPREAERLGALVAFAHLTDDLGLADARGVEPGGDQEQVLGRTFSAPRAQAPFRLAGRGPSPGQELERLRAQVRARRLGGAREDQLDAVTRREVRELAERVAACEGPEPLRDFRVVERELGEAFGAALAPRDADHR